jgi:hypothetical protein
MQHHSSLSKILNPLDCSLRPAFLLTIVITVAFVLLAPKHGIVYRSILAKPKILRTKLDVLVLESKCPCRVEKIKVRKNVLTDEYEVWLNDNRILYSLTSKQFDSWNVTCDLYNVLRRGPNQRVVSFSLYGKADRYYRFLDPLVAAVATKYPGWVMRVYYDQSIDQKKMCEIECFTESKTQRFLDNADFCNANNLSLKLSLTNRVIKSLLL